MKERKILKKIYQQELFDSVIPFWENHSVDSKYGGYLNRKGERLLPLKGGKWKGCFHVPRGLYMCMREFEKLEACELG